MVELILSVLVRLAFDIIFTFLGDTLALDTLLDLRYEAVHVLLVSADERDCVSSLAPSRVTVRIDQHCILLKSGRCVAYLPTLIPSGSTFLANSVK